MKEKTEDIMERNLETKIVKAALKEAGINCRVGHGKGTSWGWLYVFIDRSTDHDTVLSIVQGVTGRHGNYDGRINIFKDLD